MEESLGAGESERPSDALREKDKEGERETEREGGSFVSSSFSASSPESIF